MDIFISYAREDRSRAKTLADALAAEGFAVWWDRSVAPGEVFDEVIDRSLKASKCVVVLWSRHSVVSRWVRTEAAEGADREILVPVLLEEVGIPLAFRRIQAANLAEWDSKIDSEGFSQLVAAVRRVLATADQPGSAATDPRSVVAGDLHPWPRHSRPRRRALWVGLAILLAILLILFVLSKNLEIHSTVEPPAGTAEAPSVIY